jgi:hypothetical protein
VENHREWLVQHPGVVALAFGLLSGLSVYNVFHSGMRIGQLRAELADHARAASEALGG